MTRTLVLASFMFLAALPLATADPGASVATLDGDGAQCASSSSWWSDGETYEGGGWSAYGSSYQQACADDFDYAAVEARDHRGEAARVAVHASHDNSSDHFYGGSDSWSYDRQSYTSESFGRNVEAWSRGVTASTRAGEASAGYGCSSSYEDYGRSSASWNPYGSSGDWQDAAAHRNGCGATAAGAGESATLGNGCGYDSSRRESYQAWDSWSEYRWQEDSSSWCFTGADSSLATAGLGSACTSRQDSASTSDGNTSQSWSYADDQCADGVVIGGPDGMMMFAGIEHASSTSCDTEECWTWNNDRIGSRLSWEHNPFGPGEYYLVYVPLP